MAASGAGLPGAVEPAGQRLRGGAGGAGERLAAADPHHIPGLVSHRLWGLESSLGGLESSPTSLPLLYSVDQEEVLSWAGHEDRRDVHMACWEVEFLPVAQKLLARLQPPDQM